MSNPDLGFSHLASKVDAGAKTPCDQETPELGVGVGVGVTVGVGVGVGDGDPPPPPQPGSANIMDAAIAAVAISFLVGLITMFSLFPPAIQAPPVSRSR